MPTSRPDEPERLLLIEIDGPIWTFLNRPDAPPPERTLDLPARFQRPTHTYSLAFHPRYPAVPHVFVLSNRLQPKPAENVLARFTVTHAPGAAPVIDQASEQEILRWPSDGHNGGEVAFGPDGLLYVSTGDGSSPGDPRDMGQRVDVISGGVLRLDIERTAAGKNYAVPPTIPSSDSPTCGRKSGPTACAIRGGSPSAPAATSGRPTMATIVGKPSSSSARAPTTAGACSKARIHLSASTRSRGRRRSSPRP